MFHFDRFLPVWSEFQTFQWQPSLKPETRWSRPVKSATMKWLIRFCVNMEKHFLCQIHPMHSRLHSSQIAECWTCWWNTAHCALSIRTDCVWCHPCAHIFTTILILLVSWSPAVRSTQLVQVFFATTEIWVYNVCAICSLTARTRHDQKRFYKLLNCWRAIK